jgi:hypothetical protein
VIYASVDEPTAENYMTDIKIWHVDHNVMPFPIHKKPAIWIPQMSYCHFPHFRLIRSIALVVFGFYNLQTQNHNNEICFMIQGNRSYRQITLVAVIKILVLVLSITSLDS